MRHLTIVLVATLLSYVAYSQTYEMGLFVGGSNVIGDVGSASFIAPNSPAIGIVTKWNRSSRHSFRFSAIFSQLIGDDLESAESRRQLRGLQFENNLTEFSLGLEYTFWDFDMFKERRPSTPYLYTGITTFNHDDLRLAGEGFTSLGGSWNFAIPMVVGYKIVIGENLIFALELGARYTFTDNLDGSFPKDDTNGNLAFGNINNDDWYMFTGVTVTYSFGRKPCFCAF